MEDGLELEAATNTGRRLKNIPRWVKWLLVILLVIVLGGGALAYQAGNKPVPVKVSKITRQDVNSTVFASGRLEAVNEQAFFTPVDSTLMELNVKVGDRVKKGQVLGRLDTAELATIYQTKVAALSGKEAELANAQAVNDQLDLKVAETEYSKAKNHYSRMETLFQAGAVNMEELESARVDLVRAENAYQQTAAKVSNNASAKQISSLQDQVELARQDMVQARERLDMATFTAQMDGVVTLVGAKKGNRVQEGSELLVIGDDKLLEVTAEISEIDAGNLKLGQPVSISCIALPGKTFTGEIARIGGAAVIAQDNNGQTIKVPVTVKIKGNNTGLRIGYSVDLTIKTAERKQVLAVPFDAVVKRNGRQFVYVVRKSVIEERQIRTRRGNELYDIVLSGLTPGEEVVINPAPTLKNGQKVIVARGEGRDD
ncbi:MAG: efflux RND transporter periplasmic adaptor subunit [Syntrophomonadaceae bacterium]|jgi:HlyD family secretion protein